jgi:hypothetical protein
MTAPCQKPRYTDAEAVAHCMTIKNIPLREAVARRIAWDSAWPMPQTWKIGNCLQTPGYQQFPRRVHLVQALIKAGYPDYIAEHSVTRDYDTMTGATI